MSERCEMQDARDGGVRALGGGCVGMFLRHWYERDDDRVKILAFFGFSILGIPDTDTDRSTVPIADYIGAVGMSRYWRKPHTERIRGTSPLPMPSAFLQCSVLICITSFIHFPYFNH
jgi:hypothetical protein